MNTEQKIDKIFDLVHSQSVEIAKFLVKSEQYDKGLKDIKKLESNQSKALGALSVITVAVSGFFTWLFKH